MLTIIGIAAAIYLTGAVVTLSLFLWQEDIPLKSIDAPMVPFVFLVAFGWPLGVLSYMIDWCQRRKDRP